MKAYMDGHGRPGSVSAPCSSVRCAPLNSRLDRIAPQNGVNVAMELLKIIDRREDQIGAGKRPTPIEADAVMRAGARQLKAIIHADRGKSARQDRLGAGVVIHEFV